MDLKSESLKQKKEARKKLEQDLTDNINLKKKLDGNFLKSESVKSKLTKC